jgi:hypothetical protein
MAGVPDELAEKIQIVGSDGFQVEVRHLASQLRQKLEARLHDPLLHGRRVDQPVCEGVVIYPESGGVP